MESRSQQGKPPPVRNYNNGQPAPHQRQISVDQNTGPVTHAELDRLRGIVSANPGNHKQAMLLAKKLVEAGSVLASDGGRADRATAAKNRERYIMDAHKIVKKLVAAGYPDAQFYLGDCYGSGELGVEVDPREAFKLYQAAAKNGHAEAAYRTAMCCEMGSEDGGGTSKDYAKAVQWYKRAAALGDASGMFKVGVISLKGLLGQPRNVGDAVIWLKRSVQQGKSDNPSALYELAVLHESANTIPDVRNKVVADDAYALELFQRAAKLGHKSAQFRLGQAYEYGQMGLTIDNRASISWYSKAAAQGEHQAELALSGWYLTGAEGILEHSDMEAYLWARKAASSEPPLAKAMFAMGYFTETGIGCPASIEEAK
jgi:TPR repeat protein